MKLIGIITAWCAEPFIEPAIKQALDYCDEVVVSVGLHHNNLAIFEDNTMDICQKYAGQIKLVESVNPDNRYGESRGKTIQKMLTETGNNKSGNWIVILDCDEFYFPQDIEMVRDIMKEDKFLHIDLPEKDFVINMKHYAKWHRNRFKKLIKDNTSFRNNEIGYENTHKPYKLKTDKGMFHYSFLINHEFKREFWRNEYGGPNVANQAKKWGWIDNVYLSMDLNNQLKSVEKCKKLGYGDTVLGHFSFNCKDDGTLFRYEDLHPPHIEEFGLPLVEDFRLFYNKKK